jgi:glyoxylase-like metal-dependent hydrolase (beta-lactamase superfamily II)
MKPLKFDRSFDAAHGIPVPLSPLIRRIVCNNPSAFTFKGTCTYLVGHGDVGLIDPGPDDASHFEAILSALAGEKLRHILVTHRHMDHSPLAARLKEQTGATVIAAKASFQDAAEGATRLDASIDRAFMPDQVIAHGEVVEGSGWTLEAVFTPGHLSDHTAFALREEQALFSGDHVMAWATSVVAPPEGNMGDYMRSLKLLLERDDHIYYPGHGPSRVKPKALVRGYLGHRRMREKAILAQVRAARHTLPEIVRAVYADLDPKLMGGAALSTHAHLLHLIEQGRVVAEELADLNGRYAAR